MKLMNKKMKKIIIIVIVLFLQSCSTANYSCTYKNNPRTSYNTTNIGKKYAPSKSKTIKIKKHKVGYNDK